MSKTTMDKILSTIERVSLVKLSSQEKSLRLLSKSIESADKLSVFRGDTTTKPLVSVCQEKPWTQVGRNSLILREDIPESQEKSTILDNATVKIEDYFVTPKVHTK